MHFASPPILPLTPVRAPAGPPKMKRFRLRCQALVAALGRALLSRRRLSGCAALEIPRNPIQGFIPLALLAGALVLPSPLPSFRGKTDTQLERLGGYSLAADQGGFEYSLFTVTQEWPSILETVAVGQLHFGGTVFNIEHFPTQAVEGVSDFY